MSQPSPHTDTRTPSAFSSSPTPAAFQYMRHPHSFRHIPGAELISALCDITEGIALVLEIVEQVSRVRDGTDEAQPLVSGAGCEVLLRYAIASAQSLNRQAWTWVELLDDPAGVRPAPQASTA